MQAFGREDVRFQTPQQRFERRAAGPDLVGQGRQAEIDPLTGVAFSLAVQGLMLPVLLEQDHRQQAGASPATRYDMEGRRRLGDRLAIAAGDLLANVLDDLPGAGHDLEGLGDILAQPGEPGPAAAGARRRRRMDDACPRQVLGERLA